MRLRWAPCFSDKLHAGQLYDDYGDLVTCFPAWSLDVIRGLGRSERKYWVQFGRALHERNQKRTGDLISKLVERADSLLGARRRR